MSSARRKSIALRSVVTRRSSGSFSYDAETASVRPADIRQLVRVYLIDGSSKVLQMEERRYWVQSLPQLKLTSMIDVLHCSTVEDVLLQLKFNMDLESVSTYALYSVEKNTATMIPLPLKIRDVLANMEIGAGLDDVIADRPRILFRSWIYDKSGKFERSVYQDDASEKTPSSSLWLKFIEEVHMTAHGKYLLTREESILLGVLRMQVQRRYVQ